jgi:hypothetical protein
MHRKFVRAAITVGATGSVGFAMSVAAPAQSASDVTPPTLTSPVKASFIVGSQIPLGQVPDCSEEPTDLRLSVPVIFRWNGTDDSGVVSYSLVQNTGVAGPEDVFVNSAQRSYIGMGTNRDQFCGGGNPSVYQWDLTAEDPSGNAVTNQVFGGRITLTQDNNATDEAQYATRPIIGYTPGWSTAHCACWSGGTVHKTRSRDASASIEFSDVVVFPSDTERAHVALVAHTGPNRGKFRVTVNAHRRAVVDTYSATNRPRVVVWQGVIKDTSVVLRIHNLATPERPRIDIDAILTN